MTNELVNVQKWLAANKLSLNIGKTKCMIIKPSRKPLPQDISTVALHGVAIEFVSEFKFLGIILNNKLSWTSHINYIRGKISRNVGIIQHIRHTLNKETLFILYYSMIFPYLSYANLLWGNTFITHLQPLFLLQKRAIRIITLSKQVEHTEPLFKQLKILNIFQLNQFTCIMHAHKFIHDFLCTLEAALLDNRIYIITQPEP